MLIKILITVNIEVNRKDRSKFNNLQMQRLRIPDIHEAQKHSFFTFCLIFLSSHNVSKIWMILSWPRVHRWEKWSQLGKCHLVAELKLKTLNMQKVTFSISTPPPGSAFKLLLHFSYLWNIAQKSIIQILIRWVLTNFT